MSTTNMDPFDEFEFKPLTDGLGFHKKAVSLKEGLKTSGVLRDELQSIPPTVPKSAMDEGPAASASLAKAPAAGKKPTFEDVLSALEKTPLQRSTSSDLQFTEPLPREKQSGVGGIGQPRKALEIEPVQSPFPKPDAYNDPMGVKTPAAKQVPTQAKQAGAGTRRGAADSPRRKLEPATASFPSAALDLIVVTALALVFLVALLTVTKVDSNAVLRNISADLMTQISLSVLFVAVMQMYVVIARAFFGCTLGEWTFDFQVGNDQEQALESYPFKVVARSLLTTLTGLVLLPVISSMIGRDIAGRLSGARLYRQRI
jgi:hypothetical protein